MMSQVEQRDCVLVACAVFASTILALALSPISPLALMLVGAAVRLLGTKGYVTRGIVGGAILAGVVALIVAPIGSGLGLLAGFGAAHAVRRGWLGCVNKPASPCDNLSPQDEHVTAREG